MALSKEQFLSRRPKPQTITLSDGAEVNVMPMNELQRSKYEMQFYDDKGEPVLEKVIEARRALIQICVKNDSGSPMFTESELSQMEELDAAFLGEIFDHLRIVNGLDKNKADVKEARKN